jgi:hypothetical protein
MRVREIESEMEGGIKSEGGKEEQASVIEG